MFRPRTPQPPSGGSSDNSRNPPAESANRKRNAMKHAAEQVLDDLPAILTIAGNVAGNFGVPGLQTAFSALGEVVKKVQKSSATIEGIDQLNENISLLKRTLQRFRGTPVPESVQQNISNLFSEWKKLEEDAKTLKTRNHFMRILRSEKDARKLAELVQKYNRSLTNAQLESALNTEVRVADIQDVVHQLLDIRQDDSPIPKYAEKAQYNANIVRRSCLKGTRVKILKVIHDWIDKNGLQAAEGLAESGRVYWINGTAGAGKTTIAFSVADECSKEGKLVASFFCARSDAECSDANFIFVTISRQICRIYPAFKEKVDEALKKNPDLVHAKVSEQLQKLIVEPLEALKGTTLQAYVIVIDALDECKDQSATSAVLSALSDSIDCLSPLRFVITSRPEPHITGRFVKSTLADATTPLILHEVEPRSAIEDIKLVLHDGFEEIKRELGVTSDWPSTQDRDHLAELSNGLFIFASTALGFVKDSKFSDPEGQLQSLLKKQSLSQPTESIMDGLYLQILKASCHDVSGRLADTLQTVLGAITLAQEPLSTDGLVHLLGISEILLRSALSGLRSVLYIPEDRSQPIRVIHATFPQYLLRESSSKPAAFHIQPTVGHRALLYGCLDVLNVNLHRDILEIKNPTLLKDKIPDLPAKVARHIPSHLRYACRYWAAHLQACLGDGSLDGLFAQVQLFLHNMLLYWIEACIWLDAFTAAVTSLDIARSCFTPSERFSTFVPLFIDCRRFALAYSSCIQIAPLQVYYSALSLAPRCSLVAETYAKEVQHSLIIHQGARMDWGPHLATMQRQAYSVAFAPNGGVRFVTGGLSHTVYVWDSTTYTNILSIDRHTGFVFSVRYSPDGKYIVSGSGDGTVRLWDAESGAHIRTLEGYTDSVLSLTYSAGNRVLAATATGSVKLWDASDGRCMLTFDTGVDHTRQVSMSPNGSFIAYGTNSSLCLWSMSTEERAHLDLPGDGQAALFSPDGQYVAGATETMVHIWRVSDRALTRVIEVPQKVYRMAFSGDSTQIGCGCKDGSVWLWQVATDDPPQVLTGHQGINDIAWSPDGSQLISAGADNTIRVWDLSHRATTGDVAQPRPHRRSPDTVPRFAVITDGDAFTLCGLPHTAVAGKSCSDVIPLPEGAPLVTLCSTIGEAWSLALASKHDGDDDLRRRRRLAHTWEFWMGRRMFQRRGSSMPLVLSQDGLLLAYTSPNANQSIHICDLRSGTDILTFAHGHTSHITAVSFSADGKHLATGSADNNVKVWDVASGRLVASHSRHTKQVESVALSSDGRLVVSGQHGHGGARVLDTHTGRVSEWHEYLSYAVDFIFTSDDRAIMALTDFGLLVWDVATETNTHTYSNYPNPTWLDSVSFSPDDTGILLGKGGDTIQLWRPGERTWPVYTIGRDGWVYAKRPGRTQRLCWLPVEWRNPLSSDGDTFCVFDYGERKVVELDMSQFLLGAETWSQ